MRYELDRDKLRAAMQAKGFRSFRDLAAKLKVHRNTIGNYVAGASPLPPALEKILGALDLSLQDAFREVHVSRIEPAHAISHLIDRINEARPDCAIVLFGSRARGTHKRFSDYDLGVFRESGIAFDEFSSLLNLVAEWNENELSDVQLSNLALADEEFLRSIRKDV